jgi:hypothetical protein
LFIHGKKRIVLILPPETKQRTLEELDYIFAVPTRKFAHYQLTKALPYWFKRWVLFQKSATLEPLMHNENSDDDEPAQSSDREKTIV